MIALALALAASSAQIATPATSVFALVIGNNAGGTTLPDLAYADDDALRMADLLEETGAHVELLTRVDDDTARNEGPRAAHAPTRAEVEAALARIATVRAAATGATTFFLYFAGHGDAERGTGSLALEDGRLLHADLARAIDRVGATTTHVVLDACNAFFVVHARGASGRAWATPNSAGTALSSSTSDVGLFLSTSAEAQVFEWSQLQGGVFSHALRSGLRGAADADLDGLVTYLELEAFVRMATQDIANAVYVPHVFTRAPADDVLLDLRDAPRVQLVDAELADARYTVRDARGTILVDVRPEPGFAPRVLLPADALLLEVVTADGRRSERALTPGGAEVVVSARGPAPLLGKLFASTWGPSALESFRKRPVPDEVFGLTASQERRMLMHLTAMRDGAREARLVSAWSSAAFSGALGVGFTASSVVLAVRDEPVAAALVGGTGLALGGFAILEAFATFHPPSVAERTADHVLSTPPSPTEPTAVRAARVVRAVETIEAAAETGADARAVLGAVTIATVVGAVVLGTVAFAAPELVGSKEDVSSIRTTGGGLLLLGGLAASIGLIGVVQPTDAERLEALMRADPDSIVP